MKVTCKGGNNRKSIESLDRFLDSLELVRKRVRGDGSCLFRSAAEQILLSSSRHADVRKACVDYLGKHRDDFAPFIDCNVDEYIKRISQPQAWGGHIELQCLSRSFGVDILLYQSTPVGSFKVTDNGYSKTISMCYVGGNHYDTVYSKAHMQAHAICQQILYEVLETSLNYKFDNARSQPYRNIDIENWLEEKSRQNNDVYYMKNSVAGTTPSQSSKRSTRNQKTQRAQRLHKFENSELGFDTNSASANSTDIADNLVDGDATSITWSPLPSLPKSTETAHQPQTTACPSVWSTHRNWSIFYEEQQEVDDSAEDIQTNDDSALLFGNFSARELHELLG